MRRPRRRHYSEPTGRPGDIDAAGRAHLIRAFALSLPGLLLGFIASALGTGGLGWSGRTAVLVTLGTWAAAFFLPLTMSTLGGRAAATIHNPSGRSTPTRREYSHAESLVARGLVQEGIDAFMVAIGQDPSDPTPYLRIARLYRDRMDRPDEAERWFKRALSESQATAGTSYLATRELVELYVGRLREPARAAPLLARMADEREGSAEGRWAAEELARVKLEVTPQEGEA